MLLAVSFSFMGFSQIALQKDKIDYSNPKEYYIGGITISGVKYMDNNILIMLSGLSVGDKIKVPGDDITKAIKKLWKQGLFENIDITYTKISGDKIFLDIHLVEQPKLSKYSFRNIRKSEADDLKETLGITRGDAVNKNTVIRAKAVCNNYFIDKGFYNVNTRITIIKDTTSGNMVSLVFDIKKGKKVKIAHFIINGNTEVSNKELAKHFKETKQKKFYRIWKASRFIESDFKSDLDLLIAFYNSKGYRDARIIKDSVERIDERYVNVYIDLFEGKQYFFGDIKFVGNTKYPTALLERVLNIKRGDVYNQQMMEKRLFMDMEKGDVHSLYMNQGYLFSSITPVETRIHADTIDLEIRIYEGKQAIVKHVTIRGNTKTNDHVIMREIRTKPGELFNRADIIRTQRELAQLKYFDPEKLNVNPKPNPIDGTVDIEYIVEETSSDQIEMSLGWGMGTLIGTVGVSFNNFSARNLTDKKSWNPIPSGDGQKLSLRIQSNGVYYQSYSA